MERITCKSQAAQSSKNEDAGQLGICINLHETSEMPINRVYNTQAACSRRIKTCSHKQRTDHQIDDAKMVGRHSTVLELLFLVPQPCPASRERDALKAGTSKQKVPYALGFLCCKMRFTPSSSQIAPYPLLLRPSIALFCSGLRAWALQ